MKRGTEMPLSTQGEIRFLWLSTGQVWGWEGKLAKLFAAENLAVKKTTDTAIKIRWPRASEAAARPRA